MRTKLFNAFLLGAATGALLAPEKGSDLRKKISKNAANLLDQLQDTINNGKGAFDQLKEKIINKASDLKEDMEDARDNAERGARMINRKANRAINKVSRSARKTAKVSGKNKSRITNSSRQRRPKTNGSQTIHENRSENKTSENANGRTE